MRMLVIVCLVTFVILVASFTVRSKPAFAALPPLSPEELKQESSYIVVGIVKSITCSEVSTNLGTNYQYTAIIAVETVEPPPPPSLPGMPSTPPPGVPLPGREIEVHYWQAGKRPAGWSGPGGQYSSLSEGHKVRLFLRQDAEKRLNLVEPNGSEIID